MQNWPHDLLNYLLPDPDHIYYSFDLAQAENRIVAYVGKVTPMIDAFENNKDLHNLTAGLIFNKHPDTISSEDGSCTLGNGKHSERFWGKKTIHGLNYDFGYKSFSLLYEVSERDSKQMVEKYHSSYPGVRNNFHTYIRKCLAENRTLTNLMGRRTLFLDEWGDALFKEAYACIPQGTVGDVINERGLEYVYYNQKMFRDIALLVQVHDSLGFQIPTSVPMIEHARMLRAIKTNLEIPLHFQGQDFVVPADLTYGFSLGKSLCNEIKFLKFPDNDFDLSEMLTDGLAELSHGA
jgi:DNA polymerase-1